MEEKKEAAAKKETSSEDTLERGKKAIAAEQKANAKDPQNPETKKGEEKDAEQWHNEG